MPETRDIALALLNEPPIPTRAAMDEQKLHELAVSIRKHGVLQNLVVVPDDVRFEIVAGHRRYLAARLAGLETVPCRVYENLEDAKYGAMLDENRLREGVTPAEEGMQFIDLVEKLGWSMPKMVADTGRSEDYINERVKLVRDFPEVTQHVIARELSWAQAKAIMRCKNKKWLPYLIEQAVTHGASARTLQQYVEQFKGQDLVVQGYSAPTTPGNAPVFIEPAKERCVWCQRDDDQGNVTRISIHSYHVRDLTEFLKLAGIGLRSPAHPSTDRGAA